MKDRMLEAKETVELEQQNKLDISSGMYIGIYLKHRDPESSIVRMSSYRL